MITFSSSATSSYLASASATSKRLSEISKKLSTGKKVNSGKDDPVAISKINQLTASINGLEVANNNIGSSTSLMSVAGGGLNQMASALQQLRDVAVQASDGTISASERQALTDQATSLGSSISDIATRLNYNGTSLLDGSFGSRTVQTGADSGDSVTITIDSATTTALGIDDISLSDETSAGAAITSIDDALAEISSQMSAIGSQTNAMEIQENTNAAIAITMAGARSEMEDADIAELSAEMMQVSIQRQAQMYVMVASKNIEKNKLSLLV